MDNLVRDNSGGVILNHHWFLQDVPYLLCSAQMQGAEDLQRRVVNSATRLTLLDWMDGIGFEIQNGVSIRDVPNALNQGTLDCAHTNPETALVSDWHQASNYFTGPIAIPEAGSNVINRNVWEDIPRTCSRLSWKRQPSQSWRLFDSPPEKSGARYPSWKIWAWNSFPSPARFNNLVGRPPLTTSSPTGSTGWGIPATPSLLTRSTASSAPSSGCASTPTARLPTSARELGVPCQRRGRKTGPAARLPHRPRRPICSRPQPRYSPVVATQSLRCKSPPGP